MKMHEHLINNQATEKRRTSKPFTLTISCAFSMMEEQSTPYTWLPRNSNAILCFSNKTLIQSRRTWHPLGRRTCTGCPCRSQRPGRFCRGTNACSGSWSLGMRSSASCPSTFPERGNQPFQGGTRNGTQRSYASPTHLVNPIM